MPSISKIRFTNVVYEGGAKRYNDDIFLFDSHNGAILLENGGGKTVFIQTAIQAILPNVELAERKMKETLSLESTSAHIAIEWIINERPRRYGLTAVTLYMAKEGLKSYRYTYEYEEGDKHRLEQLPFVRPLLDGKVRPANRDEMNEYYLMMKTNYPHKAYTFDTVKNYHQHLEERFKIIASEWKKITVINSSEGGVESYFDGCKTTSQLVDQLLIPTVEEAIAGKGSTDFVQTFEKQREHFKAHKRLRRVIEENKQVEKQIASYVRAFGHLDQAEKNFEEQKINAKALYNFTKKEQEETNIALEKMNSNLEQWQSEQDEWKRKDRSYTLALLDHKKEAAYKNFLEEKETYDLLTAEISEKERRLAQLKVAEVKQKISENEQSQQFLKTQLSLLEKDDETVELEDRLIENTALLKGYFVEEEAKINQNIDQITNQQARKAEEISVSEKVLEESQDQVRDVELTERELISDKKHYEKEMEEIAKSILSNPQKERVEDEFPKWEKEISERDEAIISNKNYLKKLVDEQKVLQERIPTVEEAYRKAHGEQLTYKAQLSSLEEDQQQLLYDLQVLKPQWHFEMIYTKEETIVNQLEEKVEKLVVEKEDLFYKERLATRFADDYKNNSAFTAGPKLASWKDRWRNQFSYLELGTVFVQQAAESLDAAESDFYNDYPFWAITLIVSETEVLKLKEKLQSLEAELTHPVYICTDVEARTIIQNKGKGLEDDRKVFPKIWKDNLSSAHFQEWKEQVQQVATVAKEVRLEKERELERWKAMLTKIREFLNKYPYEHYLHLDGKCKEAEAEEASEKRRLHDLTNRNDQINKEVKKYNHSIAEAKEIYDGLNHKTAEARKYFAKKKELDFTLNALTKAQERSTEEKRKLEKAKKQLLSLKKDLQELDEQLKEVKDPLYKLQGNAYYEEVAEAEPSFSSKAYAVLVSERQMLKNKLDDKQQGREVIEEKLATSQKELKRLSNQLKELEGQYGQVESIEFPAHGEEEKLRLIREISDLKGKRVALQSKVEASRDRWRSAFNEYDLRQSDFLRKYDEIYVFQEELSDVGAQLEIEANKLQERYQFLQKEQARFRSNGESINKAITELKILDAQFGFLHEFVEERLLDDEVKQNYSYKRIEVISRLKDELAVVQEEVEYRKGQLDHEKTSFIRFCHETIYDIKLRQTCISGIEHKQTYSDVIYWQGKMSDRIHRTVKIAEEDMREHDKQLQQFIAHLHLYLQRIADELRLIPKQTRVKVEDKSKDIYIFTIPDWDEQEGKEELRRHIDWMVQQLERDEFKDEEGKEDESLVRKQIEKWLHTKQLLKNVMKEKDISVKCRKVSNDGKVSGALTSWEKSNAWSGGEKWSKNMTLFLGILNYLAEKRVPLQGSQKRHRTVIVDNPFGKASSDHVLDPVFFIAEQLGFQIIALTAHAEGKFIRKYFPVIYSCRLREAKNGESLIMTKNKEIRTAFFKDHDPEAMTRLGEQEQMALF